MLFSLMFLKPVMYKIVTIVGARPQFIKAAAISRVIKNEYAHLVQEIIIHTGQHYDHNMSEVFFEELEITPPQYKLNVGSASHGAQTGDMIKAIEEVLLTEKPDFVVLYGDTNSTLAGAIAASKIQIPVAHIEAGLRSFNKAMPEEINRILTDHVATLLFSPTLTGFQNLMNEGFKTDNLPPYNANNPKVFHCGDVMYDNSQYFSQLAAKKVDILQQLGLGEGDFILSTIHRNNNTDSPERLTAIFQALNEISKYNHTVIVLPLHPRTAKLLVQNIGTELLEDIYANTYFKIIDSVSFLEMTLLESKAVMVITDSGGVQKESYFFKKPCIVLRAETEWVELLANGNCILADADKQKIVDAYDFLKQNFKDDFPPVFGDGKAGRFIVGEILKVLSVEC